jgi:hypothetical protein
MRYGEPRFCRDIFNGIIPISGTRATGERWCLACADPCHKQFSFQTIAHLIPTGNYLRICGLCVLHAEFSLLY